MPKVSAAHLAARREQIMDAATVRFATNGFQATGMADLIASSGLSAGAVYRYFRSKDDLIEAIVERMMGLAAARFEQLLADGATPSPVTAVRVAVETIDRIASSGPADLSRVAVHAWGEALRNPRVHDVVAREQGMIRDYFVEVARRGQHAGTIPAEADPSQVGGALLSVVMGYLLQRALLGDLPADDYIAATAAVLHGSADAAAGV